MFSASDELNVRVRGRLSEERKRKGPWLENWICVEVFVCEFRKMRYDFVSMKL